MGRFGWLFGLAQRVLIFLVAVVLISFLLHFQSGIQLASSRATPTYSVKAWFEAEGEYLKSLMNGDLGVLRSLGPPGYREAQPLAPLLREQLPRTLAVLGGATVLSLALGGIAGLVTSRFGSRWLRGVWLSTTILLISAPDVVVFYFLRKLMILGEEQYGLTGLVLSPNSYQVEPVHLVAPVLVLGLLPVALTARAATVAFDDVHAELYIRTAHAKGLSAWVVLGNHALRNAWIRLSESSTAIVGVLLTGVVLVEYLFYYPGIGRTLALIMERGGQPWISSTIALIFVAVAMGLHALFELSRFLLDPRVRAAELERNQVREAQARAVLARTLGWIREQAALAWYHLTTEWVWAWRPSRIFRELARNLPLTLGLVGIAFLLALAVFGEEITDLRTAYSSPRIITHEGRIYAQPYPPGLPGFPLGSDLEGRDVLARLLIGAKYTIYLALAVTPVRFLFALPWGLLAGYRDGRLAWWSKTLGLIFAGLPVMLIPAAISPRRYLGAMDADLAFVLVTATLAVVGIPRLAEAIRLQTSSVLGQPFLEGARASGATEWRILRHHTLPHLIPQLWVSAAADMAWTLLLMAQLGVFGIYLFGSVQVGLSLLPRVPDWSSMLSRPQDLFHGAPWALFAPAAAFLIAILAFNLTAEGLRRLAQRMGSGPALPEVRYTNEGRPFIEQKQWRSLMAEWGLVGAAALAFALTPNKGDLLGVFKTSTILDASRHEMQVVIDTIYGPASNEQARQVAQTVPKVLSDYLQRAFEGRLTPLDMQQDSRGHVNVFDLYPARVVNLVIPKDRGEEGKAVSHLFFQNPRSGEIDIRLAPHQPAYVASPTADAVVTAGTMPGSDQWMLAVWTRSFSGWETNAQLTEALSRQIPSSVRAKVNTEKRPYTISVTDHTFRLGSDGRINVCTPGAGAACTWIPWPSSSN